MFDDFTGGKTVIELWQDMSDVPRVPGVYILVRSACSKPIFLVEGTGGFYKGKDPNVPIDVLKDKWVPDANIMYIGKAANLNNRISQYIRFGHGAKVGHWGGRYIWQLSDSYELLVYWKETKDDPRSVEVELIRTFSNQFGRRPFANLID